MQTLNNATSTIKEIWSYQHPVMHTMVFIQCNIFRLHGYFVILPWIRGSGKYIWSA